MARPFDDVVVRGRRRTSTVRRVRELLRTDAVQRLRRGDLLPSEWELMGAFDTSRGVVRAALELLRHEGLIDRLQGAGTFVVSPQRERFAVDDLSAITRHIDEFDARARWELLEFERVRAPRLVAERLGMTGAGEVIYAERRGMLDGEPFVLRASWIPAELVEAATAGPPVQRLSPDAFLEQALGCSIGCTHLRIEATVSDAATSGALGVREGGPLILLERLVVDDRNRPIEYGHSRLRADRVALTTAMRPCSTRRPLVPDSEAGTPSA